MTESAEGSRDLDGAVIAQPKRGIVSRKDVREYLLERCTAAEVSADEIATDLGVDEAIVRAVGRGLVVEGALEEIAGHYRTAQQVEAK